MRFIYKNCGQRPGWDILALKLILFKHYQCKPRPQLMVRRWRFWCVSPGKIFFIEFNEGKKIWFKICNKISRFSLYDHIAYNACDIGCANQLNFFCCIYLFRLTLNRGLDSNGGATVGTSGSLDLVGDTAPQPWQK